MPSEGEALRLLEEKKRVNIPDESKRVIPPKKKEVKEKEMEEKKEEEEEERLFPCRECHEKPSVDTIKTAVPLQVRSAERDVFTPQGKTVPVSSKGKEKVGE